MATIVKHWNHYEMSSNANNIIRWVYSVALVFAMLRLFELPFVTPIYSLVITGIGFMFSPIYFLMYLFSEDLKQQDKLYTTAICFMVSIVCANTALFQFQPISYTLIYTGIGVCLFLFSEFWWYKKKDVANSLIGLHRLSRWFGPLLLYPYLYRSVVGYWS